MNDPQFDVGDKPEAGGPVYYEEPPKQGRGCLFYGCLAAVVAGVIGMVMLAAGGYIAWTYYTKFVEDWTATVPMEFPVVEATEEEIADVEARWAAFREAMDKGEEAEIALSENDLNILVSREPDMKGHVHFILKDDEATAQISVDLTKSGFPRTSGRFFNATCTVTAVVDDDGRMDIRVADIEVGGKPIPAEISEGLGGENLADQFVKNPKNRELRDKIKSAEVKDSLVFVKSRKQAASKDEDGKAEGAEAEGPKTEVPAEAETTPLPETNDAPKAEAEAPTPEAKDKPAVPAEPAEATRGAA